MVMQKFLLSFFLLLLLLPLTFASPSSAYVAGDSPIAGETAEWNVLVVPPDLVYAIERTFASWIGIVVHVYLFSTLLMNANPILAITGLDVRLADTFFRLGLTCALIALLTLAWHTIVYERRTRMFKGSQKYFNRLGIYLVVVPTWIAMFAGLIADIIFGAAKVIQTTSAT